MTLEVTEEMLLALEKEIEEEAVLLRRFKAEQEAFYRRLIPPSPADRYYVMVRITDLSHTLRVKRARLGWLRRRWVPEVVSVPLYMYATRGDPKNRYPYVWEIVYTSIESNYDRLREALKRSDYWTTYWLPRRLRIIEVKDGYRYDFEDRPTIFILNGDVYVPKKEYDERPHVCEHQAALAVSILKTVGLVEGYVRERRPMTEEELAVIPVRSAE